MRLKLYRAATMAEAMGCVRSELGAEALILSTRRVGDGVEITAALEPDAPAPPSRPSAMAEAPAGWAKEGYTAQEQTSAPEAGPARRAAALAFHGTPAPIARRLSAGPLAFAVAATFRFAASPIEAGAAPLLVAGPPGAGKTLTVARLASRLVLRGIVPLVITADGQRAGATEQLAAFTRLLGIDLIVACTAAMIARALTRRVAEGPVLIDTPGIDPFDESQLRLLRDLAAAAAAATAIVVPAGLDPVEAAEIADSHRSHGASLLVANRLDGARRLGGVLGAAASGLTMIEAGIGPGAADGLVPMTPALLASRLMQFPDRQP
jgi:flagellar biosynthesis protein FlhF